MTRLSDLEPGAEAVVAGLPKGRAIARQLVALGFTLGAELTVIDNRHRGPVLVQVRGTRVALGRSQAASVDVQKVTSTREADGRVFLANK